MQFISFLLVFLFINTEIVADGDPPVVVTSVGTIRGVRASDGNYSMYMGVPYGIVNASNPFGTASPHPRLDGIYDANDDSTACPQIEDYTYTIVGSLDCLKLNIYVPDSASVKKPAAVLAFIFGGRFWHGIPSRFDFGPKFLVEQNVILITINHRLGPYGFMCLHTPEVPGNQGLRDQFLALHWIRLHIARFGGDPNRVTLFGSSSGAMSADFQLWSETEKLFNGVILQSGTAFIENWRSNPDTDKNILFALAERLGLTTSNIDEAIAFLAAFNTDVIIRTASELNVSFGPCIEKNIEGIKRMISGNVLNLELPKIEGINIMLGYTDDEMMYEFARTPPENYQYYQNIFRDNLLDLFDFDSETLAEAEKMVRLFYLGHNDLTIAQRDNIAKFRSDVTFVYSTERSLSKLISNDAAVYFYVFTHNGWRNYVKQRCCPIEVGGAYHADEVGYLFDVSYYARPPTPEDQLIIDRVSTMWANFAKYGDPTPETSALLPVKWEPVTKGSAYNYLNITVDISTVRRPFHQRVAFWDLFYKAYGQYERVNQTRRIQKNY